MAGGALRQAVVELVDDEGNKACIKETFALSNVMEPLWALGKIKKFKNLNEYHRGMVREVRAILKEEGQRRDRLRARRAERQARVARLGVTLSEEAEEQTSELTDDAEVNIRSVKPQAVAGDMEEEQPESENEMAVDEEVDNEALECEMIWGLLDRDQPGDGGGADADVESAGAGGADLDSTSLRGTGFDYDYEEPEVEMENEQEESGSYASTDYGSLSIIIEDFDAFDGLDHEAYDEYRWQLLFDARALRGEAAGLASEAPCDRGDLERD